MRGTSLAGTGRVAECGRRARTVTSTARLGRRRGCQPPCNWTERRGLVTGISDLGLDAGSEQELRSTLGRIKRGGPHPYSKDGEPFRNREGRLPNKEDPNYYREYTVRTPGASNRARQRIVVGNGGEHYYTPDHYETFQPFDPSR